MTFVNVLASEQAVVARTIIPGIVVPIIAAVAHTAAAIEKHLVLSRAIWAALMHVFTSKPDELKEMVARIRRGEKEEGIETALDGISTMGDVALVNGKVQYGPASPRRGRESRFPPVDMGQKRNKKGRSVHAREYSRRASGPWPRTKYFDEVLGRIARHDIDFATPLSMKSTRRGRNRMSHTLEAYTALAFFSCTRDLCYDVIAHERFF